MWRTRVGDIDLGETTTMAPLIVKDKVLVGNSGGEMGVRGKLVALDLGTGKEVWRAYSTGPDADVLIGPEFKPYYAKDQGTDLGVSSWPGEQWKLGGGTVWGWISYDPSLDLIYYGTGNPGVWNPDLRPGDNKWSCTIFARDPDDAFDERLRQIYRIAKDDDVAPLDFLVRQHVFGQRSGRRVRQLVDQQMIANQKRVFHRARRNDERLHKRCGPEQQQQDRHRPFGDESALRNIGLRLLGRLRFGFRFFHRDRLGFAHEQILMINPLF